MVTKPPIKGGQGRSVEDVLRDGNAAASKLVFIALILVALAVWRAVS